MGTIEQCIEEYEEEAGKDELTASPVERRVSWLRRKIKRVLNLYDVEDLVTGAHCGICGEWEPDKIVDKNWTWSLCDKCKAN